MKKYIEGFLMAWGNFFWIPCPVKRWNNNYKNYMLSWLPTIGLFIGFIWIGVTIILFKLSLPIYLVSFVLTFIPFLLSGFIHVDGFMDCADALGSYGSKEKKQEILKDSRVGSGAVIRIIFYVLCYFSMMMTALGRNLFVPHLVIVSIIPRFVSVLFVFLAKKIGEDEGSNVKSQYIDLKLEGLWFLIIETIIYIVIYFIISSYYIDNILLILALILGTAIPILIAKSKIGGMNGDIAGFGIMWGELVGIITLAVM